MWKNKERPLEQKCSWVCVDDSLSSRVGLAGIMYGAEAGIGPGVRADKSGDRSAESSVLFPLPFKWIAANTLFFLQVLQGQWAHDSYLKSTSFCDTVTNKNIRTSWKKTCHVIERR